MAAGTAFSADLALLALLGLLAFLGFLTAEAAVGALRFLAFVKLFQRLELALIIVKIDLNLNAALLFIRLFRPQIWLARAELGHPLEITFAKVGES